MVAGHPIFQAVHPTGVLGDIAADTAHHLTGRIRGVIEAISRDRPRDPTVDHPGLHGDRLVGEINLQDFTHAAGDDQQGFLLRHRTA